MGKVLPAIILEDFFFGAMKNSVYIVTEESMQWNSVFEDIFKYADNYESRCLGCLSGFSEEEMKKYENARENILFIRKDIFDKIKK